MVSPAFCSFMQYSSAVPFVTMAMVEKSCVCAANVHSQALERVSVGTTCAMKRKPQGGQAKQDQRK
jgi:hypothetical protein